jgi:hypothetical protein
VLKVRKSSWHYKLWRLGRSRPDEPKDLCRYFWHLVLFKIAFPAFFGSLALFGIGSVLWIVWGHPLESGLIVLGSIVVAAALFGIALLVRRAYRRLQMRSLKRKMSLAPPKEPSLVWVMVKARKRQMCPLIEVVDDK